MNQAAARGADALANFLKQWPEYREVLAPAGRPDGQAAVHRAYVLGTIKSGKSLPEVWHSLETSTHGGKTAQLPIQMEHGFILIVTP